MDLLEGVERALGDHDDDAVEAAVRDLVDRVAEIADAPLAALCARLHDARSFEALGLVADAAIASGRTGRFWGDLAQAHIERGRYASATAVIEQALETDLDLDERLRLRGNQGRIRKDRYLAHGNEADLVAAVDAYASGVREGADLLWLGVNAHALAHRARREGIAIDPLGIADETELRKQANARSRDDDWAAATAVEAALLVGDPIPVDTVAHRLAKSHPFLHASLRRQLLDVWQLTDDHPAIVTLSEFLLAAGATETIELPNNPGGFEKLFGNEWPVPLETYRQGIAAAGSVAHLIRPGGQGFGTGFLVDGTWLHPDLAGRRVMITNEHVIPSPRNGDGIPAEAASARFDAHAIDPIDDLRAVFWSDRTDLDVCILVSDTLDASDLPVLTPTDQLPIAVPGAHVYVVGHPGGRSLCLSIRGNELLDQDGVRIHYRAPTEPGSSGSPVFDETWRLIGTHHYGKQQLPRLNGQVGTYGANQGTSFAALRRQLAEQGLEGRTT